MQNWKDNCVSSDLRQSGFQVCPQETSPCGAEAAPPFDRVTGAPTLEGLFCSPQRLPYPQDKESMAKGNGRPEPTSPFVGYALATPGIPCTDALSQLLRPSRASSPGCLPKDGPLHLRDGCMQDMQMEPGHVDQDVHTHIRKAHIFSAHR